MQSLAGSRPGVDAARLKLANRSPDAAGTSAPSPRDETAAASIELQLAGGRVRQRFATATVIADAPGKTGCQQGEADQPGPTVWGYLLDLIGLARSDVLIVSPYVVPGREGIDSIERAVAANVHVSVMTNSLSTTDEPLVHFVYKRYRGALLKMGVGLYELIPADALGRSDSKNELGGSIARLHAKLAVFDRRYLFIGSMNMDRRSAHLNTEAGLVIDSAELSAEVSEMLRTELPLSYRLQLMASRHRIVWVTGEGPKSTVYTSEPQVSLGGQLRLWLMSRFVDEELL